MASYRKSIVVHIDCDPPVLIWAGVGLLPLSADAVLPAPMVALGGDQLIDFPDFQQLIGGTAERLDLTLSGVSPAVVRLAIEDAATVRGAAVNVGTITFDEQNQVVGIEWEQIFEARDLSVSRSRADDNGNVNQSITLTIVQGSTTRSRAKVAFFTDADQRRKSPTDAIFSHVASINAGTTRRFGPK